MWVHLLPLSNEPQKLLKVMQYVISSLCVLGPINQLVHPFHTFNEMHKGECVMENQDNISILQMARELTKKSLTSLVIKEYKLKQKKHTMVYLLDYKRRMKMLVSTVYEDAEKACSSILLVRPKIFLTLPEGIVTICIKNLKKCTSFALATPLIGICPEEM